MTFRFGLRSQANLVGVHADLVNVAYRALELSPVDFMITEGMRSAKRQQELFDQNKSKTLASRHITGHALDVAALVNDKVIWNWAEYELIAVAFKQAANELAIGIEWGGDWKYFKDGVHFQLPLNSYPDGTYNPERRKNRQLINEDTRARAKAWVESQRNKS